MSNKSTSEEKSRENTQAMNSPESSLADRQQTMTLWQTVQSVLFAMLGVQKSKNAKRDFSKGKASHFIVIGVVFGILFALSLAFIVQLILQTLVV